MPAYQQIVAKQELLVFPMVFDGFWIWCALTGERPRGEGRAFMVSTGAPCENVGFTMLFQRFLLGNTFVALGERCHLAGSRFAAKQELLVFPMVLMVFGAVVPASGVRLQGGLGHPWFPLARPVKTFVLPCFFIGSSWETRLWPWVSDATWLDPDLVESRNCWFSQWFFKVL